MNWDVSTPWYHGSPVRLTSLRAGSTITHDRDLARIFSHKPSVVVQEVNASGERTIKHTGTQAGYLYRIAEEVRPGDVYPHPQTTMEPGQEWLTTRALHVELIAPTEVVTDELLTVAEIDELQHRRTASQPTKR